MKVLSCAVIVVLYGISLAQFHIDGPCPETCKPPDINLTLYKLEGIWFLQLSVPFFWQINTKCLFANVTEVDSDTGFVDYNAFNNETNSIRETSGIFDFTNDGQLDLRYTELGLPLKFQTIGINDDFFVAIACFDCGFFDKIGSGYYVSIYTRNQFPSCEVLEAATTVVSTCGVPKEKLVYHDQTNCTMC